LAPVRGHKRYKAGAWRLTVEGPADPLTGKRNQMHGTVRAPNTKAGAKIADGELAKLIVKADTLAALPRDGITVGEMPEHWVEHRRPSWESRRPPRSMPAAEHGAG
jgi:hypothetical protein